MNRQFLEELEIVNEHMKRYSVSSVISNMQVKQHGCYFPPTGTVNKQFKRSRKWVFLQHRKIQTTLRINGNVYF